MIICLDYINIYIYIIRKNILILVLCIFKQDIYVIRSNVFELISMLLGPSHLHLSGPHPQILSRSLSPLSFLSSSVSFWIGQALVAWGHSGPISNRPNTLLSLMLRWCRRHQVRSTTRLRFFISSRHLFQFLTQSTFLVSFETF